MDFVAIDFETANEQRCSPCSLGLTVVRANQIVEEKYWLIRPKENRFAPINIMIHGIRPDDVNDAPEFDELWDEIRPYLEGSLVVAHNASFDLSVLRRTLDLYHLPYPELDYCCTMLMSKHFYSFLENAKLDTVNQFLGYSFEHHNACADASACANILLEIANELQLNEIHEITSACGCLVGSLYADGYSIAGSSGSYQTSRRSLQQTPSAEITGSCDCLQGKYVAFTGPLRSMTRAKASQLVLSCGGFLSTSVSRKTNLLVTNVPHPESLTPGQMSTKLRKFMELKGKGSPIELMNEEQFLQLLT